MRIRVHFQKTQAMRYTSHLDLHKTWERSFRRAGLPLAYSQGFHPQPRINLACALPLGFTSQAELMDFWLESEMSIPDIQRALATALPPGILIENLELIISSEPALQVQVRSAVYHITLLSPVPDVENKIAKILMSDALPRERRGKQYDLRSLIEEIKLLPESPEGWQQLQARLAARESATGRPEELLDVLNISIKDARIHRYQLILAEQPVAASLQP